MIKVKEKIPVILLSFIILVSLIIYTYLFFTQKKSYNSDEIWSYALSNSYYCPFLEESENNIFETWITGETFHNYITVQKSQRFAYDSVWYNQAKDVHPPFYYAILHTICSFFPERFSPWFALAINYVSFIGIMILLYKIGKKYCSSTFALVLCAFYAFSCGAEDTFTFLRMYALCAFLALFLFYEIDCYVSHRKKSTLFLLFICTLLSSLTHYYLILFAFFLTAVCEVYFVIQRRGRDFFFLGFTMLISVISAVIIFPSLLSHVLINDTFSKGALTVYTQNKFILSLLTQQFLGFSISIYHNMFFLYIGSFLVFAALILCILCLLFRKEHFASKCFSKIKSLAVHMTKSMKDYFSTISISYYILFFSLLCIYLFDVVNLPAAVMKEGTIRYLFPFYPLICLFSLYIVNRMLQKIFCNYKTKLSIALILLCLFTFQSNLLSSHVFFYQKNETYGQLISELPTDSYFILLTRNAWNISDFSLLLQTASYVYVVNERAYSQPCLPDTLSALPVSNTSKNIYLLFTETTPDNMKTNQTKWLSSFYNLPYVNELTLIGKDVVNGQSVLLYILD